MEQIEGIDDYAPLSLEDSRSPGADGQEPGGPAARAEELHHAGAGGRAADGQEEAEQIDGIPDALVVQLGPCRSVFPRRSSTLMAYARQRKATKAAVTRAAVAEEKAERSNIALRTVSAMLPGVAALLGQGPGKSIGHQKQPLKPSQFLLLSKAAFLPSGRAPALGVKHKRVICAATNFLQTRQRVALKHMLQRSHRALTLPTRAPDDQHHRYVHMSYLHIWDETKVKSQNKKKRQNTRQTHTGLHAQTLMQRGVLKITCGENELESNFVENWLCKGVQVPSTTADSIYGGLKKSMPSEFFLAHADGTDDLAEAAKSVTSLTVQALCDRASGNLVILRWWAHEVARLPEGLRQKVLYWPDTCAVHAQSRGKLTLKGLRKHTMRHFSIAHLHRQAHIHNSMVAHLERLVARRLRRRVAPPPGDIVGLKTFVQILFDLHAAHHTRGKEGDRHSQRWHDLQTLCSMLNGDLRGEMVHWCWDPQARSGCCKSESECTEKTTVALINCLLGEADPVPAESRWTHLLSNMRKTLLRRVCYKVGHDCFNVEAGDEGDCLQDIDDAAVGLGAEAANRVRARRTIEYYASEESMRELPVYTVVVGAYDEDLLYPLLGDPVGQGTTQGQSKLDALLDRNASLVAACANKFLHFLRSWTAGGPSREPWAILDMLACPVEDSNYKLFARNQILRLASAIFRRFELKFSSFPFRLHIFFSPEYTQAERHALATEVLGAPLDELDPYTIGIRTRFDTEDKLLSTECIATLRSDFEGHGISTDLIERMHSVMKHTVVQRARAKNFANLAREDLLKQAAAVHVARGGVHPLGAKAKGVASATEMLLTTPLLQGLLDRGENANPTTPQDSLMGTRSASSGDSQRQQQQHERQPQGAPADEEALAVADEERGCNYALVRKFEDSLLLNVAENSSEPKRNRGLNPFLLERNKRVQAAKMLKGGKLTDKDLERVKDDFKKFWDRLADKSVYEQAYKDWLDTPPAPVVAKQCEVLSTWAAGSSCSPISARDLWRYQQEFGWPTDDEVFDKTGEHSTVLADNSMQGVDCDRVHLWSIGCRPNNVSRLLIKSAAQFQIIHQGFSNAIDKIGRDLADSGGELFVVSGPKLGAPTTHHRFAFILTGVTFNPRFFEVAMCDWEVAGHKSSPMLPLPSKCSIRSRPCRVTDRWACIDMRSSAELICEIMDSLEEAEMFRASYTIPDVDGSLLWSEISKQETIGHLWRPGMTRPTIHRPPRQGQKRKTSMQAAFDQLLVSDPFSSAATRNVELGSGSAKRRAGANSRRQDRKRLVGNDPETRDCMLEIADRPEAFDDGSAAANPSEVPDSAAAAAAAEAQPNLGNLDEDFDLADALAQEWDDDIGSEHEEELRAMEPADEQHDDTAVAEEIIAHILTEFGGASEDVGVAEGSVFGEADGEEDAAEAAPAPSASSTAQPWELLSDPSPVAGYVTDGKRTVMRIQRGKPLGRCTVTCYRHPSCNVLLNLNRTPDNQDLYRWLYEVEETKPDATPAEKKRLSTLHTSLAKARWSAPKARATQ